MDDNGQSWFERAHKFFTGGKENHTFAADIAKTGLWALFLLNIGAVNEWLGLKIDEIHEFLGSPCFKKLSAKATKLWKRIDWAGKIAVGITLIGWFVAAMIFKNAEGVSGQDQQKQAIMGISAGLIFSLAAGAFALFALVWSHVLVGLTLEAKRLFGNALELFERALPSVLRPEQQQTKRDGVIDEVEGLDKVRKTFWAVFWWLKVLELVIVEVICTGYRVFNTLVVVLVIIDMASAFMAYKNAYGINTEKYRVWAFRYLLKIAIVGFVLVTIGPVVLVKLVKVTGIESWLDERTASIDDETKAKADAATAVKVVGEAKTTEIIARAKAAAKDLPVVSGEIEALEAQGMKTPLSPEDQDKLLLLKNRQLWDLGGRRELAPMLIAKPVPTCSDGKDNNGDGVADRKDFSCYKRDSSCKKNDPDCSCEWDNYNDGQPLTKIVKNAKVRVNVKDEQGVDVRDEHGKPVTKVEVKDLQVPDWYRYDPNREEKTITVAVEEKKEPDKPTADNAPHGNHNGGTDKKQAALDYLDKCAADPDCKF
jgi:hypothetical protein